MGVIAEQRLAELLEQFTLASIEVDWRFHRHPAHQVARATAAHRRHALATQTEQLAGLGAFRDFQLDPAIQGRHFQLATQGRIGEADRHFAIQVLAVALENCVLAHIDHHVQVARRTTHATGLAFARQANAVTGIDTRRHLHRQGLVLFHPTLAVAGGAGLGNHLAIAMATRAGLLHREEALLHAHLADAATGGAGDRRGALLGARAIAGLAVDQGRHANGDRGAAHRLFQVQLQGVAQVAAALGTATLTAPRPAEEVAEYVTEDIGEVRTATAEAPAATHLRVDAGMTVLVEGRALAGVGEHLVGLVGLLELLLRRLIVRIAIRVVLHGQAPVSLFQLRLASPALHTQHFVIVTLSHKSSALSNRLPPDTPTREQAPAQRIVPIKTAALTG